MRWAATDEIELIAWHADSVRSSFGLVQADVLAFLDQYEVGVDLTGGRVPEGADAAAAVSPGGQGSSHRSSASPPHRDLDAALAAARGVLLAVSSPVLPLPPSIQLTWPTEAPHRFLPTAKPFFPPSTASYHPPSPPP